MRLSAAERRLIISAALLLWLNQLGLWALSFRTLRRLLDQLARLPAKPKEANRGSPEKVAWAVELAGRYIPRASTCLTRALAAQLLLLRRGHPALLRIGVTKSEDGELRAHAWVESGNAVVIGGYDLEQYVPLATLRGADA